MIGKRFDKPLIDFVGYAVAAQWCNEHRAQIVEREGYYEVVPIPAPSFDEMKQARQKELNAAFDERVAGSFETSQGYSMQFDTSDAIKMEGAIKLLEATGATEGYLTQADDTTVYNVPIDTMKAVLMEMMGAFAACHARKQELRAAINAAQTVEDLDAIKITWPL
jgi:hypothetical protein